MSTSVSSAPTSTAQPAATSMKHYLVLFITDKGKEHDFRAHKTFASMEAAIEEAKKFSDPPKEAADSDDDDDDEERVPFEWEYNDPSSKNIFAEKCRVAYKLKATYEGGAIKGMSWMPVIVVVEVAFENR